MTTPPGSITQISPISGNSSDWSGAPIFSPDGTKILFTIFESSVSPNPYGNYGIFLKDLATGTLTRIIAGASTGYGFSPDGSQVLFTTSWDVFTKDLATGTVIQVNTDANGAESNGSQLTGPALSPDGTHVLFISNATNLVLDDTNGVTDVFVKDLTTGAVTRANTDATGAQANGDSFFFASFSPDGTGVLFGSDASNLVPGDTNATTDFFLKDLSTGAITRLSTAADGTQANGASDSPIFSPDGARILFRSSATNLIPGDIFATGGLFIKDVTTGVVTRVDTDALGTPGNSSGLYGGYPLQGIFSPDGTRVAFISQATNLVPGASDTVFNIYIKNLTTGAIFRASTDPSGAVGYMPHPRYWYEGRVPTLPGYEPASSESGTFSPDGNSLVFTSRAMNFVLAADGTPVTEDWLSDIFLKSLEPVPLLADIAASQLAITEGDAGSQTLTFTITRSGDTSQAATVAWTVTGTGAHPANAADFDATGGLLTFRANEITLTIDISIAGDTGYEPDEGFTVTLRNTSDGALLTTAAGTIENDDTFVDLAAFNVSAGAALTPAFTAYTGPVARIERQWLATGPDNVNATAWTPNWFIHTGDGNDAIAAHSGTNVLDGGGGSNFLTGGTGADTFFLDARNPTAPIWSTLAAFGDGDAATIWGISAADFALDWFDSLGAPGYAGLTALASQSGAPVATLTLTGYTKADLTNGTLFSGFGHDPVSNSDYLYIAHT